MKEIISKIKVKLISFMIVIATLISGLAVFPENVKADVVVDTQRIQLDRETWINYQNNPKEAVESGLFNYALNNNCWIQVNNDLAYLTVDGARQAAIGFKSQIEQFDINGTSVYFAYEDSYNKTADSVTISFNEDRVDGLVYAIEWIPWETL